MAEIYQPKRQSAMGTIGKLLPIAGAITGAALAPATGGASAMLMGAGAGSGIGSVGQQALGMFDKEESGPVKRRMSQIQVPEFQSQPKDQYAAIQQARLDLQNQPKEMQQQYMPVLTAAALRLNRQQGMG